MKFGFPWIASTVGLAIAVITLQGAAFGAPLQILPLGDSITAGVDFMGGADAEPGGGYRYQLYQQLTAAGKSFTFVGSNTGYGGGYPSPTLSAVNQDSHEGHSGYTIANIDSGLKGTGSALNPGVANTYGGGHWLDGGNGTGRAPINPDIVVLDIGSNDAYFAPSGEAASVTAANMAASMTTLLGDLKTDLPNAQVFVATLYCGNWVNGYYGSNMSAIESLFNAALPGIVAGFGSKFHLVDMTTNFPPYADGAGVPANYGGIGVDGLHPETKGYAFMGNQWALAIQAVPEPSTKAMSALGILVILGWTVRQGRFFGK